MSIVSGNYVRETSVKRRNKIVQEITRKVASVFSFDTIIAIEHVFFNALTFARSLGRCGKPQTGFGFQHLPRDLANVNAWKTMFDPHIIELWNYVRNPCPEIFSNLWHWYLHNLDTFGTAGLYRYSVLLYPISFVSTIQQIRKAGSIALADIKVFVIFEMFQ